jgi:phosphate transport system protein
MAHQGKHISGNFDAALDALKSDVLKMSSLTDQIFQRAINGLLNRNSELCDQVISADDEIDIFEKQVDQDGLSVLIRFQPVASDMRAVFSAMKISTDLERIADESTTIARRAKHLNAGPAVREVQLLEPPYRSALGIFQDSMRAYADGDSELALTLHLKARELDALTRDVSEQLIESATVTSQLVPTYLDLIFVARALQRIGDHAANIAEDSFWRDEAIDIRHTFGTMKEA